MERCQKIELLRKLSCDGRPRFCRFLLRLLRNEALPGPGLSPRGRHGLHTGPCSRCVYSRTTSVSELRGRVYFEAQGKRKPLADVTLEVTPFEKRKPPIATSVTKEDGTFVLQQIQSGRHYLSVRHAAIIGLSFEVRVNQQKRPQGDPALIEIVLRNDPTKYCAGATATVIREVSLPSTDRTKEP
jgi:hypothetical protein